MQLPKSKQVPLAEYLALDGVSQGTVAQALGVYQSAVSQWVQEERNIFIETLPDGSIRAWEIRAVPWKGKRKVTPA